MDFLPVKYPVLLAIVELFLDTVADFKTMVGCDRDIPGIEKPVDVGPEQEAIFDFVGTAITEGLDVGGL